MEQKNKSYKQKFVGQIFILISNKSGFNSILKSCFYVNTILQILEDNQKH